jgi:hypothetical protein
MKEYKAGWLCNVDGRNEKFLQNFGREPRRKAGSSGVTSYENINFLAKY